MTSPIVTSAGYAVRQRRRQALAPVYARRLTCASRRSTSARTRSTSSSPTCTPTAPSRPSPARRRCCASATTSRATAASPPAAADRAVATVRRLKQLADALGATEVLAKATSAIAHRRERQRARRPDRGRDRRRGRGHQRARRGAPDLRGGAGERRDRPGARALHRHRRRQRRGHDRRRGRAALGRRACRSASAGSPPSSSTTTRRRRPTASGSRTTSATVLEPLVADVRQPLTAACASGRAGRSTTSRAWRSRTTTGERARQSRTGCASRRDAAPRAARPDHARRRSPNGAACPGSTRSAPSCCPAGSMLLVTALDLFDVETLTVSDWALREGIVLDAVRTHDPDDWSDDPRALRRAAVANLARRCNSDERAHRARRRASRCGCSTRRSRCTGSAPTTGRCSSSRRCCTTSASTCRRKGHHRHAAYLVENAQLRGFAPSEIDVPRRAGAAPPPRRPEDVRAALRCAVERGSRCALRKLAALLRVADGLDRGRRGVVEDLTRGCRRRPRHPPARVHGRCRTVALGCAPPARPVRAGVRARDRVRGRGHTERLSHENVADGNVCPWRTSHAFG